MSHRPRLKERLSKGDILRERYRIEHLLGHGGMAQVYRAHDQVIERTVAIKILNLPLENLHDDDKKEALDRFEREIKASARIEHANAITVYDAGILRDGPNEQPFMVMELLQGHDLDEELNRVGALPPKEAIALCLDALDALDVAHAQGVVHKDLKPSNLFVRQGRRRRSLCVVDFGIAHITQDPTGRLTNTGFMCGTPQYLSPEYVAKQRVLPAGDVYQMGLILVEMLTGAPVVNDDAPYQCIMRHGSGQLDLPPHIMDSALGPVITEALAHNPEERFADAGLFADALRTINPDALDFSAQNAASSTPEPRPPSAGATPTHDGPPPARALPPRTFAAALSAIQQDPLGARTPSAADGLSKRNAGPSSTDNPNARSPQESRETAVASQELIKGLLREPPSPSVHLKSTANHPALADSLAAGLLNALEAPNNAAKSESPPQIESESGGEAVDKAQAGVEATPNDASEDKPDADDTKPEPEAHAAATDAPEPEPNAEEDAPSNDAQSTAEAAETGEPGDKPRPEAAALAAEAASTIQDAQNTTSEAKPDPSSAQNPTNPDQTSASKPDTNPAPAPTSDEAQRRLWLGVGVAAVLLSVLGFMLLSSTALGLLIGSWFTSDDEPPGTSKSADDLLTGNGDNPAGTILAPKDGEPEQVNGSGTDDPAAAGTTPTAPAPVAKPKPAKIKGKPKGKAKGGGKKGRKKKKKK